MENRQELVRIELNQDNYKNLRVFLKSINMARLSSNLDTDELSMAIAMMAQAVSQAREGKEEEESVDLVLNREQQSNLLAFLQNLNLARLQNNTDTITLSIAVAQVAQVIQNAEVVEGEEAPEQIGRRPNRVSAKKPKDNVTPLHQVTESVND